MKGFREQDKSKKKSNNKIKVSKEQIISQAFKFHSQGNISEAAKYYQYFIDQGFNDHRVFSNYGVISRDLGKLEEAELLTRKAIKLFPNYANAHYNLGNILKDLGKFKDAELSTRKAIELNPAFAMAHSNLGGILKDLGKFKEAELSTRKAIELNPALADAYFNLGNILRDLGKFKEAELSLRKAIEIKPDFAMAYTNLGSIMRDVGNLKEAELFTQKGINIEPSWEAYFHYASCLYENKEFDSCLESLKKAKALIDNKLSLVTLEASIASTTSAKKQLGQLNQSQYSKNIFDKRVDRLIINREVENNLISHLHTIKTNQLDKTTDTRYGNGVCSDFSLFDDTSPIISALSTDIKELCKKELRLKEIFVCASFFNIFVSGSGQPPHTHIKSRDRNFNLDSKKYSLVYYLDVGDQDCEVPGILKLHEPEEEILPTKGMIIIIGAERSHSVSYHGNKKRVMIGVNFYGA